MKIVSVLAIAILALASVDSASAISRCDQDDANKALELLGHVMIDKDCGESVQIKNATTSSATTPPPKCPNTNCLTTIAKLNKEMPNCVGANGVNPRAAWETELNKCNFSSASVLSVATRSTAVSAAVALASTVLAVAMVAL